MGWDRAEKPSRIEVMETSQTSLGKEHPIALTSTANLAAVFMKQARSDDKGRKHCSYT